MLYLRFQGVYKEGEYDYPRFQFFSMRFFIKTYGCQINFVDSEKMAEYLMKKNFQLVKNHLQADFVIVNLCSVRQNATNKAWHWIENTKNNQKKLKIILIGCILENDQNKFKKYADLIIASKTAIRNAKFEPSIIWQKIKKEKMIKNKIIKNKCGPLSPKKNKNAAYLPVMTGCNNFCAYCVVPYTRGTEKSLPAKKIIQEFKKLIKIGCQEIILLGQNVNSYQSSDKLSIDFSQLLKTLNSLPGNFQISFLTNHPKDMTDELIETIAQSEKVKKYIHLPIQSGSNKILKKMNRHYTREDYFKLIKKIKEKIPACEISTDVIVGFPGETKKNFQATANIIKKYNFKQIYIGKYSPRPGTSAFKLKDNVSLAEKKRREEFLREILKKKKTTLAS